MRNKDEIPAWFGWIADRGVVFWRVFLLLIAVGFLTLAFFINSRLQHIEKNLRYQPPAEDTHVRRATMPDVVAKGQSVFVPAYSHVYHQDGKPFALAVTLVIHNADRKDPITVSSVKYFGTKGTSVTTFVGENDELELDPMGSLEFLVAEDDLEAGG